MLSGWEQGPVAGWFGQGKSYLAEKGDQWQDGVNKVKVNWLRTETSVKMLWTG